MIPCLPDGKQPTNDFDGITNVSVFSTTAKYPYLFPLSAHKCNRSNQILRGIDRQTFAMGLRHPNAESVFEPPQLFERLHLFEHALRQFGDLSQHIAPIGVESDVFQETVRLLPAISLNSAQKRNRRTAEVEGMPIDRTDNFRRVWIKDILPSAKRFDQCRNLGRRLIETPYDTLKLLNRKERFIALHIM